NNGVTPVLPRLLFCGALFAWGFFFIKKLFLANRCRVQSPFPPRASLDSSAASPGRAARHGRGHPFGADAAQYPPNALLGVRRAVRLRGRYLHQVLGGLRSSRGRLGLRSRYPGRLFPRRPGAALHPGAVLLRLGPPASAASLLGAVAHAEWLPA